MNFPYRLRSTWPRLRVYARKSIARPRVGKKGRTVGAKPDRTSNDNETLTKDTKSDVVSASAKGDGFGKSFRDWSSFTLSILAFGISATGFYFGLLEQNDDLSLIVLETANANIGRDLSGELAGAPRFVFINSGNQSAVITKITVSLGQLDFVDQKFDDCTTTFPRQDASTKLDSFVIKPGEIFLKEVPVVKTKVSLDKSRKFGTKDNEIIFGYVVCYDFEFATPKLGWQRKSVGEYNTRNFATQSGNTSSIYYTNFSLARSSTNPLASWWRKRQVQQAP